MYFIDNLQNFLFVLFFLALVVLILMFVYIVFTDKRQKQHAVLRSHPLLARFRYIAEKVSPEFRDYFGNNKQPFSKADLVTVVKSSKYLSNVISFGSERDYDEGGLFLKNSMFPLRDEEFSKEENVENVKTKIYKIDNEGLFSRKEHLIDYEENPYLLKDEESVVIGSGCKEPFVVKGLVGMSAMSYGSIGKNGIRAFSHGLGIAGGTWMNTGEGGLSDYHLEGGVDLIYQIGPAKFGLRNLDGSFSWEHLIEKSKIPQIKAFELKLAQGAKIMGGKIPGSKVNEEVAAIRGVEPWKDLNSPKRFDEFSNELEMLNFIDKIREVSGKPVGIKVVLGGDDSLDELMRQIELTNIYPDFITVDGGEGGSGSAPSSHMLSLGLGVRTSLPIVDSKLKEIGYRDKVKIIASGKLIHPERVAVALCLGADLVNTGRGLMLASGCIMAGICSSNKCPVGLATTDPKLMGALVVDEKKYRVANYILSMRKELYSLASACGIDSPVKFNDSHVVFVTKEGKIKNLNSFENEIVG